MILVENISLEELDEISYLIGEAFVNNDLFYEFGDIKERRNLVLKYMEAYVKCAYASKTLYKSDDGKGFIGLCYSDEKHYFLQLIMMIKIIQIIPFKVMKRFIKQIKAIADGNKEYTTSTYLEVLMVCVRKEYQGQGKAKELVDFAKEKASSRNVPLLLGTDMEAYAKMYQHLGCKLYNTKTALNGVTRYNLVWKGYDELYE